jgi:hypothetical protein
VSTARRLWQVIEPVHAVLYFAPELRATAAPSGLAEHGSSYFACRAAPLGKVTAATVTAIFYGFSPARVARSVPAMWDLVDPAEALRVRASVADAALRRLLGAAVVDPVMARATELSERAVDAADTAGRPLAAANAELGAAGEAHVRLWQALTTLREHRGDGHVTALVDAGVSPCASHVLRSASGAADAEFLRTSRGWSPDEWTETAEQLRADGLLARDAGLSDRGRALRDTYEGATDRLAAQPFGRLGAERTEELAGLLHRFAAAVVAGGGVPVERGLGSPWPPQ